MVTAGIDVDLKLDGAKSAETPGEIRGRVIWTPTDEDRRKSKISALMSWLAEHRGLSFDTYEDLWHWSVTEPAAFWDAVWHYFGVETDTPYRAVMEGSGFQGTTWFPGARLNFARMVLRHEERRADDVAISAYREDGSHTEWTWAKLGAAVRQVATRLRAMGVEPGDRVAACVPNVVEAAVCFIATTAIGAVWSSCSPEFGAAAATDRFSQIEPRLLIGVSRYTYAGTVHERGDVLRDLVKGLPTLEHLVLLQDGAPDLEIPGVAVSTWASLAQAPGPAREDFHYESVSSDHPLWIVYTSGTTGAPKPIVHTHAGALLGLSKDLSFHVEVGEGSVPFFYATPSWIVWNMVLGGLSLGARVVLYDGSPFYPDLDCLWSVAERSGATIMGVSPGFIARMKERGHDPSAQHDLHRLKGLVLSGAVTEAPLFEWLSGILPSNCRILSQAGSTEVCGGYAGGVSLLPIRAGEATARMLGMDVLAIDPDGRSVHGEGGELVIGTPFANAPKCLWNDPGGERMAANYLSAYGGRWQQGDMIIIHEDGGCKVLGRSDATMKRNGVRIGAGEIYRALEDDPAVADAIAVFPQAGSYRDVLILFLRPAQGHVLDDNLRRALIDRVGAKLSPRHVPDLIEEVPAIPYTLTGKRLEIPLRHLLEGQIDAQQFGALLQHDRETAHWFAAFAARGQSDDQGV
ncbi:MAG: acetoacetate--CoA ligase [Betaproteobacteria bacterium]|nr:acetoacetate--CoA ligase [Betaproteobacteria bacterium]